MKSPPKNHSDSLKNLKKLLKDSFRLETGFTMLEAVVVVGVLLAVAAGGFLSYGSITQNAKTAAVRTAASSVYTAILVAQSDGDPSTSATDAVDDYNSSNSKLKAEIREAGTAAEVAAMTTAGYTPKSDNDFCLRVTNLETPTVFAEMGNCKVETTPAVPSPTASPTPESTETVTPAPTATATEAPAPEPTQTTPVYVDSTPTKTILNYKCDTTTSIRIPMRNTLTGTETWSDGLVRNYNKAATATSRTLTGGYSYSVTFDGTYLAMGDEVAWAPTLGIECLTNVVHWGEKSGVINASNAFNGAVKLTDVPEHIPSTITKLMTSFYQAYAFNDPDISKWDVSNVSDTSGMLNSATKFNQPLDGWNMSKVTTLNSMFASAYQFNQPLNSWTVVNVKHMTGVFDSASSFNKPLNNWNTSNVTSMLRMFKGATAFNQDISNFNTVNVTDMNSMFYNATNFNQYIKNWNVSKVTNSASFRTNSALTAANSPF